MHNILEKELPVNENWPYCSCCSLLLEEVSWSLKLEAIWECFSIKDKVIKTLLLNGTETQILLFKG